MYGIRGVASVLFIHLQTTRVSQQLNGWYQIKNLYKKINQLDHWEMIWICFIGYGTTVRTIPGVVFFYSLLIVFCDFDSILENV